MSRKRYGQGIALGAMCVLSLGIIFSMKTMKEQGTVAASGTPVDVVGMNADTYQVKELHKLEDGSYVVYGAAKGFAGDIETAATFDETGENILSLKVLSQGETDGIGSKVTEDEFISQFHNIAVPIKVADLEVVSPTTGKVNTSGEAAATTELADENYSSIEWNPEDTSPEANAMRTLYDSGLLASSKKGEKLSTPITDLSPEEQAKAKLQKANLLVSASEDEPTGEPVTVTDVDAVSGATVSSKAVATTINNGYFFLKEAVLK
ncbi:FMN-binding protein [Anaerocolumna sp.]|uniref:FMN-binding protein n=1 Tax=Anaerocolumna sp. TaxID=2041569 RepID=UPI0028B16AA2|nr:FMN-binding protein [Anaerocolumna sp.]